MYQEYFLFDVMHKIALCEYCFACFCVCCFRRVVSYESPARKPHRRITASRTHNACADVNDHRSTWSNYRINMQEYGPFGRADDTKRARCLSFFRRGARENRAAVRHIHIYTHLGLWAWVKKRPRRASSPPLAGRVAVSFVAFVLPRVNFCLGVPGARVVIVRLRRRAHIRPTRLAWTFVASITALLCSPPINNILYMTAVHDHDRLRLSIIFFSRLRERLASRGPLCSMCARESGPRFLIKSICFLIVLFGIREMAISDRLCFLCTYAFILL